MKKSTVLAGLAAAACAALALAGCTGEVTESGSGNSGGEGGHSVFYVDVIDSNPIMTALTQGFNAELAENDIAMTRSLAIDNTTGTIDIAAQAQAFTRAISSSPDAIAWFVLDSTALRPQVEEAMAADIPVFAAFGKPEFDVNAYIEMYDEEQGYIAAKYLADNLPKGAKVTIIGGPATTNVLRLEKGAMRAFEEADVEVVGDLEQQRNLTDNAAGGKEIMQGILQQNPDIAGVFGYNDDTVLGAISAVKQAGADVQFTARNGSADAIAAIKAGDMLGTCDIQPTEMGRLIGKAVVAQIKGEENFTDSTQLEAPPAEGCMVTAENVDDWKDPESLVNYVEIPLG